MNLEADYGIPSVAIHANSFARLVAASTRANGMPRARQAFVPQPVADQPPAKLRAYIEGDDPVSGRPFARQVLDALTNPLDEEDVRGATFDRGSDRLLDAMPEDELQRLFVENRWTDMLPIVLPTEERVEAMLAGTSRAAEDVVGLLRPAEYREYWQFTVEQAAVNTVMAGARPEYFPVVLALLASGVTARHSSTTSIASMVVINGPIRDEIAMNSGIGALGPYNHANATIGRAYGLGSQNLQGGSVPGVSYMGSVGNHFAYTSLTFAENEERSPWRPYHVQRGFDGEASAASIFKNCYSLISTWGVRETWQERLNSMVCAIDPGGGAVLILDPLVAHEFAKKGFTEPQELAAWIFENARKPAREWWDGLDVQVFFAPAAQTGEEPWATYARAAPGEQLPMFQPEDISVVVVGGETQPHWGVVNAMTQGFERGGVELGKTVSIDEWR
jgi:hypothetical protein